MEKSNKWVVILIVLVAVGLVVDLLSLNVLYTLANSKTDSNQGQLAEENLYNNYAYRTPLEKCENSCERDWSSDVKSCGSSNPDKRNFNPNFQGCMETASDKAALCVYDCNN